AYINNRYYWVDVLAELRQALIRAEEMTGAKFRAQTGVWIEQVTTAGQRGDVVADSGGAAVSSSDAPSPRQSGAEMEAFRRRYGLDKGPAAAAPVAAPDPAATTAAADAGPAAQPQFGT